MAPLVLTLRFALRRAPCCALLALAALAPRRAQACDLKLMGEPSPAWQQVVEELPRDQLGADDCALLRIDVAGESARLTFVTRDGRRAERTLASPAELAPALDALRVVDPAGADEAPARAAPSGRQQVAADRTPPASMPRLSPLFTLLAGFRVGSEALLAPALHGALLMQMREAWELGVFTTWETRYFDLGESRFSQSDAALERLGLPPARGSRGSSAVVAGLGFARRQPLARSALLAGARLAFAYTLLRQSSPGFTAPVADEGFGFGAVSFVRQIYSARAGLFAGLAFPARGARARACASSSARTSSTPGSTTSKMCPTGR